jgi:small subunit ribosomal protein S2e
MSGEEGGGEGGRGGFGRGGGRGRGGRGRGRGRGRGGAAGAGGGRGRDDENVWVPVTKLGRLVKERKIQSIEEIFLFSIPVKEAEIIDYFLKDKLQDEVMKIMPVQKQSSAGQRTRFKAFVAVGDSAGHIGLGVKCSSEVATAIRGAIIAAKLNVAPVRRGYWGRVSGMPHTVPCKVTGKCGSVSVRLIPAPRGTGLVSSPAGKKLLHMAGVTDCYTSSTGHTRTMGNFIKAIFHALRNTYGYLTPELWPENVLPPIPFQEHTDFLSKKQVH